MAKRTPRFEPPAGSRPNGNGLARHVDELASRYQLTRREVEVVHQLVLGLANKEIADRCSITEQTVKDHLKHVYQKTGVHQRTALLAKLLGMETVEAIQS